MGVSNINTDSYQKGISKLLLSMSDCPRSLKSA